MKKTFFTYCIVFLVLTTAIAIALAIIPKAELHLALNSFHTPFGDTFLRYYTVFAEFPVYIFAILPLLFYKAGWTYMYAIAELSNGFATLALKNVFSAPRPTVYFENLHIDLPTVEGVALHHSNSFPSGHTATFFVFFTVCALWICYYIKKNEIKPNGWHAMCMILLIGLSYLGGFSRIYLSQHFLSDVFVGSIIGFVMPCISFGLFYWKKWLDKDWFNRSLFGYNAYFKLKKDNKQ